MARGIPLKPAMPGRDARKAIAVQAIQARSIGQESREPEFPRNHGHSSRRIPCRGVSGPSRLHEAPRP